MQYAKAKLIIRETTQHEEEEKLCLGSNTKLTPGYKTHYFIFFLIYTSLLKIILIVPMSKIIFIIKVELLGVA